MKEIKRIENFGFRMTQDFRDNDYFEVVKYQPNIYYHKYNDYVFDEASGMFHPAGRNEFNISPECFINKETAFTVNTFSDPDSDGEVDIVSVGLRPFELDDNELKAYKEICTFAFNFIKDDYNRETGWIREEDEQQPEEVIEK